MPPVNLTASQLFDWLSTPRFNTLHPFFRDDRNPGTGSWFLEIKEFQDWSRGLGSNMLYCPGEGFSLAIDLLTH
jgi:hypothetical protein